MSARCINFRILKTTTRIKQLFKTMDNSILVWFNQASNSSIKHTSDTLKDGKHLLQFAQSKLPNTDSSTVVQSTSTFNNNNFDKLRFIIQQFLTHPSILDEIKEPLSHQLKHLNTDHYLDYLEILLCCCVGLNLFLDPNTAAIEYVLTFHLLYHHLLYRHLLYRHVLYRHLLLSSLGNTYINTALTRPTVSFGRYNTRIGESEKIVCNSSYRCQT